MNFNYKEYLINKLLDIQTDEGLSNFKFEVEEEQMFVKRKDYDEKTIYIVIKYLQDDKQIGATTQPIQMLILSEQNDLEVAKILFSKFATQNNWVSFTDGTDYIKQQYTDPVILSNFNPVLYGYRSVMYMTANLTIIFNVIDIKDLKLNNTEEINAVNFSLSYNMNTNTQQLKTEQISKSVKNASSLGITMTLPFTVNGISSKFISILGEESTGNDDFDISFKLNGVTIRKNYKLISAQLVTAINQVPSLQLGFMK